MLFSAAKLIPDFDWQMLLLNRWHVAQRLDAKAESALDALAAHIAGSVCDILCPRLSNNALLPAIFQSRSSALGRIAFGL
ncbi:hypothetical protein P3T23_001048 [Paraburkholderia sp. GAS448]|uniref:hypothetical protein n=1 Tax=Paraburkholderia sp. GAS448 TaxID=3035136 RepID=UPI003D19399A